MTRYTGDPDMLWKRCHIFLPAQSPSTSNSPSVRKIFIVRRLIMSIDPATTAANPAAMAATAAVQAMAEAFQPAAFSQHKLSLLNFWL